MQRDERGLRIPAADSAQAVVQPRIRPATAAIRGSGSEAFQLLIPGALEKKLLKVYPAFCDDYISHHPPLPRRPQDLQAACSESGMKYDLITRDDPVPEGALHERRTRQGNAAQALDRVHAL